MERKLWSLYPSADANFNASPRRFLHLFLRLLAEESIVRKKAVFSSIINLLVKKSSLNIRDGNFYSQPDMNEFFDLFYYGFGFKDELNLSEKLKRRDIYEESVTTFHKLRPADRIMEYMQSRAERGNE